MKWKKDKNKCPHCKGELEGPNDFGEYVCISCGWTGFPESNQLNKGLRRNRF